MKIIKGAEKSHVEWTTRKLIEMVNDGKVDFEIDIQRGYVWKKKDRQSAFIRSLIIDGHVPPLYFNKIGDVYYGEDGKQRTYTVIKFLNDEFELVDLPEFEIINDDGEVEEKDINGYKFSDLPECFQNAIKEFNFTICFKDNASQEEQADDFFNLNNGQAANSATMNRIKAKSREQIATLSRHKLFKEALSETAIEGHVNDDLVAKAHAILNDENASMDSSWIRPYMRRAEITKQDVEELTEIFDRIYNIHSAIEDNKIAKRIYGRTHMISIVPIVVRSLNDGLSDRQMMEWFVNFFSGKKSATISTIYNNAAGGSGTGKKEAVRKRVDEIEKNYTEFFKSVLAS